jgi:hypothetical protein
MALVKTLICKLFGHKQLALTPIREQPFMPKDVMTIGGPFPLETYCPRCRAKFLTISLTRDEFGGILKAL